MARIRSIHPGLYTDEAFMSASMGARLMLIGIWLEAFDDGVFEIKPMTLKVRLFPVDAVDVPSLIAELERLNWFRSFDVKGKSWGALRNFRKFQRPKKPNQSGVLPPELRGYVGFGGTDVEDEGTGSPPVPNHSTTEWEDGGWRREEEKERDNSSSSAVDDPPPRPDAADAGPGQIEIQARALVGQEPCLASTDFHVLTHLIGSDGIVNADILAGIRAGLERADPGFRFRCWRNFVGWVRGAAKDRLSGGQRSRDGPATESLLEISRRVAADRAARKAAIP